MLDSRQGTLAARTLAGLLGAFFFILVVKETTGPRFSYGVVDEQSSRGRSSRSVDASTPERRVLGFLAFGSIALGMIAFAVAPGLFESGGVVLAWILGVLACFAGLHFTEKKSVSLEHWKGCETNADCVAVPGFCGHWDFVNRRHEDEATLFLAGLDREAACASRVSEPRPTAPRCHERRCGLYP